MNINFSDLPELIAFWLCFTRWVCVLWQTPIFDETVIPAPVKVLTALIISYGFFPYLRPVILNEMQYIGIDHFWLLTIYHACIGIIIGFLVRVIMSLFTAAGSIITQQMGFGSVAYFDPTQMTRVGPIEKIVRWTIVVTILFSGALIPIFKGIFISFSSISLANFKGMPSFTPFYLELFKSLFESALLLASPLLFTNLMIAMIMGVIARIIPQMNILMVSFVVNIGVGLVVFLLTATEFFYVAFEIYTRELGNWFKFVT